MENLIFCAVFAHLKSFDTQFRSDLNKPDLKTVFSLYDEKMYPVHKRPESGPEIAFYYFLNSRG